MILKSQKNHSLFKKIQNRHSIHHKNLYSFTTHTHIHVKKEKYIKRKTIIEVHKSSVEVGPILTAPEIDSVSVTNRLCLVDTIQPYKLS